MFLTVTRTRVLYSNDEKDKQFFTNFPGMKIARDQLFLSTYYSFLVDVRVLEREVKVKIIRLGLSKNNGLTD